jgi:hypothetical protein
MEPTQQAAGYSAPQNKIALHSKKNNETRTSILFLINFHIQVPVVNQIPAHDFLNQQITKPQNPYHLRISKNKLLIGTAGGV